jgi:hypothetical protein
MEGWSKKSKLVSLSQLKFFTPSSNEDVLASSIIFRGPISKNIPTKLDSPAFELNQIANGLFWSRLSYVVNNQ